MDDFLFKPYEEMTAEDYERIGFKSGLEIHQQLFTKKKLFCRCPAGKYNFKYDAQILRHMRPTLSELGEYDGTALMEFKTKKDIIYRINRETVCTYEMDDTPPFLINEEALDIALETALLFNCNIVNELHIARKQYLDGSIPTGFQRTAIYSLNGWIPFKGRKITILQQSIEEDSCREISDHGHTRIYITDRLGMPLIETVTGPDMKTPVEVAEVAKLCSLNVKSTGKVRTGAGAAREDVNVSVRGGTRIEIKGVPSIPAIPLLTYNEAMRQWNLLRLRDALHRRGVTEETFEAKSFDATQVIKSPKYLPLKEAVGNDAKIKCVLLKGFKDLLHWQTQTNTYFSKEISDRVRVIACLNVLPNIIHSDSKDETISSNEWKALRKQTHCTDDDTMVIVWGSEEDTDTAVKEIIIRAKEATIGIPSETRQAFDDGTNGFERILPGADRMYPDTDLPPKTIPKSRVERVNKNSPAPVWEKLDWYKELGIPADTIEELAISKFAPLFEYCVKELKLNPTLCAVSFIQYPKRLKKIGFELKLLSVDMMKEIFDTFANGLITKEGIYTTMKNALGFGKFYPEMLPKPLTSGELSSVIDSANKQLKESKLFDEKNYSNLLLANVMHKVRGRIEFTKVEKLLNNADGE